MHARTVLQPTKSPRLLSRHSFIDVNAKLALELPLSVFTMGNGCISGRGTAHQRHNLGRGGSVYLKEWYYECSPWTIIPIILHAINGLN